MSPTPYELARPPTPQALLHRLPDKPLIDDGDINPAAKPSKYVILIAGSTAAVGKVAIAKSVASALDCPIYHGESVHDSSAKAASIGGGGGDGDGPNKARYQRMWLSKMTRTGLLFPEESRPANQGFSGFGGGALSSSSSTTTTTTTTTTRRGSASSLASSISARNSSVFNRESTSSAESGAGDFQLPPAQSIHDTILPQQQQQQQQQQSRDKLFSTFALSETERLRRENPALMVLTHPELEQWHKVLMRTAIGEYGLGIIFVPLYPDPDPEYYGQEEDEEEEDDDDLPILQPLNPSSMTAFPALSSSSSGLGRAQGSNPRPEQRLDVKIGLKGSITDQTKDIIDKVGAIIKSVD